MVRLLLLAASAVACLRSYAQFRYTVTSTPDSALVSMNGQARGYTPCEIDFRWNEAVNGRILFEVSSPGFITWKDSVVEKPFKLELKAKVSLTRALPANDEANGRALIAFDKVLADLKDDTPVGRYTDDRGKSETLTWQGSIRIGDDSFARRFYEVLRSAGYSTLLQQDADLFSGQKEERAQLPRFIVGARVLALDIDLRKTREKDLGAGKIKGRTRMDLEWQVLDKMSGKVALKVTTTGMTRYRWSFRPPVGEDLAVFDDALVKFLEEGGFRELVQHTAGNNDSQPKSSIDTAFAPLALVAGITPVFKGTSDLIAFAQRSCVTVITDGGHGSGVVVDPEGFVLSAYHVVDGVNRIEVQFSDGLRLKADVVRSDPANDVVLLDIAGSGFHPLALGSSERLALGEEVITIGTPAELELGQSVAKGILSGRRKLDDHVYLQTDMSVSPGNSGGPLINSKGEVIGVVQRKVMAEGVEGIGFAIPIDLALQSLRITSGSVIK